MRRCLSGPSPDSRWPSSVEKKAPQNGEAKRRVLQDPPADDLFFRRAAYCHVRSGIDAQGNRGRAILFDFDCCRSPYSRQGSASRGHVADDQSFSKQTADLQRFLEDLNLLVDGHAHSLRGASYRFLATDWRLCCGQSKVAGGNRVAAFLGCSDHSVRTYCHVLHDARTGARNREGKGDQNIFRPDACAGGVNACFRTRGKYSVKETFGV